MNQKIFALPVPKVVPSKIKAQYELEQEALGNYLDSGLTQPITNKRLYQSVTEIYRPPYQRNLNKTEAAVKPESTVKYATQG